jgi:hypothetical protein
MKPDFVMTVPSISKQHLPVLTRSVLQNMYCAEYPDGYFVYIDDEPEKDDWMLPIRQWLRREFPRQNWVRFDCDGELMTELPVLS